MPAPENEATPQAQAPEALTPSQERCLDFLLVSYFKPCLAMIRQAKGEAEARGLEGSDVLSYVRDAAAQTLAEADHQLRGIVDPTSEHDLRYNRESRIRFRRALELAQLAVFPDAPEGTAKITFVVDQEDAAAIAEAIHLKKSLRVDGELILPDGASSENGACLAEICRAYVEMIGSIPDATSGPPPDEA